MRSSRHALHRRYGRAAAAIGKGARGFIQEHHKYAIVGLVPKTTGSGLFRGKGASGEYLKTRHVVGRARDAHEALVELYRLQHETSGWHLIVLDVSGKHGKLTPIVTEEELQRRKAAGH